jgi:transcriptional regulator with XRE-family HTH domain
MEPLRNLARIRRMREMTQAELGQGAKLLQQYVSALERGMRPASWAHVQQLATVLEVDPETLMAPSIRIDCSSVAGVVAVSGK